MEKIKYIGTQIRTNSFGTFEPNGEYEVPTDVADALLSVPRLFVSLTRKVEKMAEKIRNITHEVVNKVETITEVVGEIIPNSSVETKNVQTDIEIQYETMTVQELKKLCLHGGISVPRNVNKRMLVSLLTGKA